MTLNLLFIVIFILLSILSLIILQSSGFHIFKVGLIQFVVISLYFLSFVGTIPLFFGLDEYRLINGISDKVIIFGVMLLSGFTILLFLFGAITAKYFFKISSNLLQYKKIIFNYREYYMVIPLFILIIIILWDYISQVPRIALIVSFMQGVDESKLARSEMGNNFSGKYHWYSFVINDLAQLVTFCLFANYLKIKRFTSLFFFIISFMISSFSALMTTQKAPFIWILVGLFLVYTICVKKGVISVKKFLTFNCLILSFLTLSFIMFMGSINVWDALIAIFSRTFAGSIAPAYYYLEFFPSHHDFLLGTSFPNPGGILPYKHFSIGVEILNWVFPHVSEKGIVGSMPTVFWGECYANYGYFGVVIIPFIFGFLLFVFESLILMLKFTPFVLSFYVWVLLHYQSLSITGFSGYIFDIYLFLTILVLLFIISLTNNFKIYFKH